MWSTCVISQRILAAVSWLLLGASTLARDVTLERGFAEPPPQARTRVFWRVFGPAWERTEIDYQLELLKAAGVGGVMTFFVYPVVVDGNGFHNQRFLSPDFLRDFAYAARRCRELGLRFSVAGGTGWPFGGPTVTSAEAAQKLRSLVLTRGNVRGALPLASGEEVIAVFQGTNDITRRFLTQDWNPWTSSSSTEPVTVYVAGQTRMQVKRPAVGGEGWVVDHYNARAAVSYLEQMVAPMLRAAPNLVESIFCDSLEVYGANWTAQLPAVFARKWGQELRPLLPEIFNSNSPGSPQARFAFWQTLCELTAEQFTHEVSTWAHRHGVRLEMEPYGTPPNPLSAARYIDVPTGEQYEWRGFSLSRLASSSAHLTGRRIVGAEAWTWLGLPNRLGDGLSDMKLASDLHFLAGINDLTAVDFAYSPRTAGTPGWMPYYGPVLNQNNPQWPWFRDLLGYTSRCQWLLRQGRPVAEVALYLPVEDQFAFGPVEQMLLGFRLRDHFVSGEKTDEFGLQVALRHKSDLLATLLAGGFDYDGLDFFTLNTLARIGHGRLHCGDGDYGALILPRLAGIERRSLERVLAFGRSGGVILVTGRWPERVYDKPGCERSESSQALLEQLSGNIGQPPRVISRNLGRGRVIWVPDEREHFAEALAVVRPTVRLEPRQPAVGVVCRRTPSRDIYFLANVSDEKCRFTARFHTTWGAAERWNAMSGQIEGLAHEADQTGSRSVKLELGPRTSTFVVWGKSGTPEPPPAQFQIQEEPLNTSWTLSFRGRDAPVTRTLSELVSWTTWPDARFFSGQGVYCGQFVWNHPLPQRAWLVFTRVAEAAGISLNGQELGSVWAPPQEVEISRWLKRGPNSLVITVGNLPLNGFLGAPEEDLAPLRAIFGERFPAPTEKQKANPAPSGLIGAVRLRYSTN